MSDIEYLEKYLSKDKLEEGIYLLKKGIPVQYIVGNVDFFGNIISVNKDVLIPRFETELLVDKTIRYAKKMFNKKIDIVDLGTGSGCIAITLKKKLNCEIDAVDISEKALDIAKKNALQNNVKINFILSDMLDNNTKKYDIIISNPPYIDKSEKIDEIVKNNEPHIALYASNNGLEYYEKILKNIKNNLKNKSLIAFEIGKTQGHDIEEIAKVYLPNSKIIIEKDYCKNDRYIFIFN